MTLSSNTVYPYSLINTNFDPPRFSLESTLILIQEVKVAQAWNIHCQVHYPSLSGYMT
jgi:hypothetical protein